jgi:hypothetical protein
MIRFLIIVMLCVATPVVAQEPPGKDQVRGPYGMGLSDGISAMILGMWHATPPGEAPPPRYFSRELQARMAAGDLPRGWLRPRVDAGPEGDRYIWVLNTTGPHDGRPASADVSLGFRDSGWGRRLQLIDQDGYWVIGHVCLFPEATSLHGLLDPSRPDRC